MNNYNDVAEEGGKPGPQITPSPAVLQGDLRATKGWRSPDRVPEPLYAIVPVINAHRYKSRWKHAARAIEHFVDSGAVVYVVEVAFGEREFAMDEVAPHKLFAYAPPIMDRLPAQCRHDDTLRGQQRYIKLRTSHEIWLKESAIMVGASFLPHDAKYLCFLDADIAFAKPNWVGATIHALQHYKVVQMFSSAHDLNAKYEIMGTRPSFVHQWRSGEPLELSGYDGYGGKKWAGMWSGLAWAMRRSTWDMLGGIPDFCIHGGGDWHLAFALIEQVERSVRKDLHPGYVGKLQQYEALCKRYVRRDLGVLEGSVFHHHHGPKALRHYADRHKLLAVTQFNPETDLRRDMQGLYRLNDDGSERYIWLRDGLRAYAKARDEDDPCS